MEKPIDIRTLDEWMYSIHTAMSEIEPENGSAQPEALKLLRNILDDMRERRAQLRLRRHNEVSGSPHTPSIKRTLS